MKGTMNFKPSKLTMPETQAFMRGIIEKLEGEHAIEVCDYPALHMLELSYDNYLKASAMLMSDGPVTKDKHGHVIVHPAVNVVSKTWGQVVTLMKEFGLTVKSRERISALTAEVDEDNELGNFDKENEDEG